MNPEDVYLGRDDAPPDLERLASGKVRDIYTLDAERLLFVTTDRVSAFDVVMNEGIPHKGRVLTSISAYWFEHTREIIPNHLLSTSVEEVPGLDDEWRRKLEGRIMIVQRCEPSAVEWVVRGYVVGSGWKEYQERGTISEVPWRWALIRVSGAGGRVCPERATPGPPAARSAFRRLPELEAGPWLPHLH